MKNKKVILMLCALLAYIPFSGIGYYAQKWLAFFMTLAVALLIFFVYEKKQPR